jgi:hypothetical protein
MYVKYFVEICVPTCFGVGQIVNYLKLLDPGLKIGQFEALFCLHTENKSYSDDPIELKTNWEALGVGYWGLE